MNNEYVPFAALIFCLPESEVTDAQVNFAEEISRDDEIRVIRIQDSIEFYGPRANYYGYKFRELALKSLRKMSI